MNPINNGTRCFSAMPHQYACTENQKSYTKPGQIAEVQIDFHMTNPRH